MNTKIFDKALCLCNEFLGLICSKKHYINILLIASITSPILLVIVAGYSKCIDASVYAFARSLMTIFIFEVIMLLLASLLVAVILGPIVMVFGSNEEER